MATESPLPRQSDRVLAALAYPIWIVALIIVLTDMKKDPFMRHHGWLALFWAIAWVVIHFGWIIVASLPWSYRLITDPHGRSALLFVDFAALGGGLGFLLLGRLPWPWLNR